MDENRYPQGKAGSLVGVLFEIENSRSLEQLQPVLDILGRRWKELMPASLRRALVSWIFRVVVPGKSIDATQIDIDNFSEVQVMLRTRLKQQEQEQFEKGIEMGIEKGIEKGPEEGVLTGEATILRRQLQLRFGPLPEWVNVKIEHAQRAHLEQWSERVLDAKTLDAVFA